MLLTRRVYKHVTVACDPEHQSRVPLAPGPRSVDTLDTHSHKRGSGQGVTRRPHSSVFEYVALVAKALSVANDTDKTPSDSSRLAAYADPGLSNPSGRLMPLHSEVRTNLSMESQYGIVWH